MYFYALFDRFSVEFIFNLCYRSFTISVENLNDNFKPQCDFQWYILLFSSTTFCIEVSDIFQLKRIDNSILKFVTIFEYTVVSTNDITFTVFHIRVINSIHLSDVMFVSITFMSNSPLVVTSYFSKVEKLPIKKFSKHYTSIVKHTK